MRRDLCTRRLLLVGGLALGLGPPVWSMDGRPSSGRLDFEVWRKGRKIGRHSLEFAGSDQAATVTITAEMAVKLGPVTVFRYRHQATEQWRGDQFARLHSRTTTNGAQEGVEAARSAGGVKVETLAGKTLALAADAAPLTHWSSQALTGPLFNPQTGAVVRKTLVRLPGQAVALADGREVPATGYRLSGDAEITDWYDGDNLWAGLKGRAQDGSTIEYRRLG